MNTRPFPYSIQNTHGIVDQEWGSRLSVVREAWTWVGTKYHHAAMIKGAGVDCAMLLCAVYFAVGLMPYIDPRPYPRDWHKHRDAERYLNELSKHAHEIESPLPGDIAVWKFGRTFSHGAVVVNWPIVIHAYVNEGCGLCDATKHARLADGRPVKFFSVFGD